MTTEELQNKVLELTDLVKKLQERLDALNSNATIPLDVGEAFKLRILSDAGTAATSTKNATSEDTTVVTSVNFGASSTTTDTVLGNPDGYLEISITNNLYYIPYYL